MQLSIVKYRTHTKGYDAVALVQLMFIQPYVDKRK